MGGRLDATNIVTPLASVITNIQLDHQKWLGETVPEIAREKAGIIKPGIPGHHHRRRPRRAGSHLPNRPRPPGAPDRRPRAGFGNPRL